MIYWHVERKNVCVYSQLRKCSPSKVAAMMEGLIRHAAGIDSQITANRGGGGRTARPAATPRPP